MNEKVKKEIISMLDDRKTREIRVSIVDELGGRYDLTKESSEYIFNVMAAIVGWNNGKKKNV